MKDRSFRPLPVRERMIPKTGGKLRRLGIATIADRVVQAALKPVLEPIFEADFHPCSYGFRPNRRAHDAVAEVRFLASCSYEWIVEGDIKACFDEIYPALMERVRARVGDKRVLALVKAFLTAGILGEDRLLRESRAGTPQGSILSPLLSNVALSVLDGHIAAGPGGPAASQTERAKRRRHRLPNYRLEIEQQQLRRGLGAQRQRGLLADRRAVADGQMLAVQVHGAARHLQPLHAARASG